MPTTQTLWITRQLTTVRHIRGLLEGLQEGGALDFAEVKIMVVESGRGVLVPRKAMNAMRGTDVEMSGDVLITDENLPPEGILVLADEME